MAGTNSPRDSPRTREVLRRRFEARNILSSFERDTLPIDYLPDIYKNIDHARSYDPQGIYVSQKASVWTIPGELQSTLLQHAAHVEPFLGSLRQIQEPDRLVLLFQQKVERELKKILDEYDQLTDDVRRGRVTPVEARNHAEGIRQALLHVSHAIDDQLEGYTASDECMLLQEKILPVIITAINNVCDREANLTGPRQPININLFDLVFHTGHQSQQFMIHSLLQMSRPILQRHSNDLGNVRGRLIGMNRPEAIGAYADQLRQLLQ